MNAEVNSGSRKAVLASNYATRIHVNDFGCQARDLNLAVFSMVIFLSTFKRRLLSRFITSEAAFNLAKVAIFAVSK